VTIWVDASVNSNTVVLQILSKTNSVTSTKNDAVISNTFELYQNYPNPFNPTTNISFSLQNSEFVSLKVFNAIGQEVKTLVSENMSAGAHTVTFNASDLTSGVYFYRLESGNTVSIKKMMLMK
ncbi:MAG: T9SS type A sorting domain-containing protein, partial [Ignavibacteriae bacterium]|nr:T9SS type A sorting domain-containing protein [Ignavibacteriota bacterium]